MSTSFFRTAGSAFVLALVAIHSHAAEAPAGTNQVSFHRDLTPIFKRSCTGCHHPGKLKGELDITTHAGLLKGGKHGASFVAGQPKQSRLIDEIVGDEPSMPKEGDALSAPEIALIERWIVQGALDDTPTNANSFKLDAPPIYTAAPVISALAFSPDGQLLAVSGYHEVLLRSADGSNLIARLVGESPRIDSFTFSTNGRILAVSGGAPSRFGEIQIWDTSNHVETAAWKAASDSLYGISLSPESDRVAVGGADKSARIFAVKDGRELLKFDNHSDWVFNTAFTLDGKRILTASRDRAMKLVDAANGQFIDDVNKLLEGILCMTRHPSDNQALYGGENGAVRIYKISDNQNRGAGDTARDANLLKEFEKLGGPVHAVAFSADGKQIAVGGQSSEVRVYNVDGKRTHVLTGHQGAIFALAFDPLQPRLATGGFDGSVRYYDLKKTAATPAASFIPVPITPGGQTATAR